MKLRVFLVVAVAVVIAFTASGFGPGTARGQTSGPVVLTTQSSPYGSVLFTGDGKALYMLTNDTVGTAASPAKSSCTDKCAAAWPPLLAPGADGPFQAEGDVRAAGLGTIQRADGTFQVTYFGWPLYEFVADKAAGQTNGENVGNFNGLWHLLSASGRPNAGVATVTTESTATGTALSAPTAFNTFRSLYTLTTDPPNTSTCFGGCARFWPPLLTTAQPIAGTGTDASALGTARRPDGTLQVTYAGRPLYFFAPDVASGSKSGDSNGEDSVDAFNLGIWYLLTPGGVSEPGAAIIGAKSTDLGTVLTYSSAAAPVYAFSADRAGKSSCTGFCARIWTPVLTTGAPQASASSGVGQDALGTIQRADGTTQVTYHGQPLYTFSRDYTGNGGQGMMSFGGSFNLMLTSGTTSAAMPSTRAVVAVPQLVTSGTATSASFTVAFTSSAAGQGSVLFAPGATCSALVEVATRDALAGGTTHMVTVTGNDMPGTVGDNGIQPGTVYSYEVVTFSRSGQQVDNNAGKCYTVSIPRS
jgi:predicted lipoprotein with Yx(FWY)xxD motif